MRTIVSVIGAGHCSEQEAAWAREVGRLLAERGFVVLTGGRAGVMAAASRGAKDAGGVTVGVLPGLDRETANPHVDIAITTGLSDARNLIVATSGICVVAVGGKFGTLSEIALARKHGIPVVGLGTWDLGPEAGVTEVATPAEAVAHVAELAGSD